MTQHTSRRAFLAAVGVTSVAGCAGGRQAGGSGGGATDTPRSTAEPTGRPQATSTEEPGTGTPPPRVTPSLPLPMAPAEIEGEAVSGGPPKDGIPSIDDPSFVSADSVADRFEPGDPVFGLERGGEVKAYPQKILVLHEICNDVVDGTPVSVTYCPLTGTAMGFERGDTTFGVSGRLVNNNLIMYDRGTETWWPQVLATSIPGPWNGAPETTSLSEFRVIWTTWDRWTATHPDTQILSFDTGFAKNYAQDPYGAYNPREGYYADDASPMFPALNEDDRLAPKRAVIGTRTAEGAAAFDKQALRSERLLEGDLAGSPVVAAYDPELDTGYVFRSPDNRRFEYRDGRVADGSGETYAPSALPTERLYAFDAMWFAWSGFYPETPLYD
ncbi:hypothetical protein GCM10008995_15830 [Halobellus salinus]|uniref:DUF3179 domain-containing protein n=1 Tax=Halobellus salinus TaxID=931585 RepID=A0A830EQC1_9EURY|nr:DUF3179 domain-containing protein [Halobellus salinus]GGJ06763.1 hypothetical protein GCM10008995_15830 [Halobellus salinus]SMP15143.1 Protein of unknown function [Halobellus salinus]